MKSKIKLDKSHISIVVLCTGCEFWHGFALDLIEAWQVGVRHQEAVHPGNYQAAKALWKQKNAARSGKVEDLSDN